jgi:hypothetical protein
MGEQEATGKVETVQEQRFRLHTSSGRALLLTLAHDAPLDGTDLERLHRAGARVRVRYTGAPNLDSAIVHSVEILGGQS